MNQEIEIIPDIKIIYLCAYMTYHSLKNTNNFFYPDICNSSHTYCTISI